jgi:hypothetical protein
LNKETLTEARDKRDFHNEQRNIIYIKYIYIYVFDLCLLKKLSLCCFQEFLKYILYKNKDRRTKQNDCDNIRK